MKRIVAVLLVSAVSLQLLVAAFTIVRFEFNKSEIIAAFCVNKDKPQLNCNGNCHLNKQLNPVTESETDQPAEVLELSFILVGPVLNKNISIIKPELNNSGLLLRKDPDIRQGSLSDVFHPPRY